QQQKQRKISGVVKDAMGEAIIGASVIEKGNPTNGTITDINGKFSLNVGGNELQITYIGYMPETVSLKTSVASYNIIMKEDTKTLDEVVVVGYGVQKKANLTGSVASISAEALESRSVASVSAAMAGTMPGVTAIQTSGAPGLQTGTITVRGKNSVNSAGPLVIVDGVPGSMNSIDPQDIESLTVLKDAASAAIYGVQAANGVILITTKKGKKGQDAKVSYSGSVSWATPTTKLNFLGSADYAMLYNEAVRNENPNAALPYTDKDIELFRNGSDPIGHPNTDWYKETFKNFAFEQQHNFSINGGSEKTNYSASVGYLYQGGLTNENDYNRFTGRINVESEISKWFSAGLNVSGYRGTREDGAVNFGTLMSEVTRNSPTYPVYNEDGTFNYSGKANPVAELGRTGFYRQMDQQLNAILHATVHILPELSVKGVFSVRNDIQNIDYFKKHYSYGSGSNIADSGLREGYDKYYIWNEYTSQLLVNYNKSFQKHTIGALFGFEQWEQIYKYTEATRKGGGSDELTESLNTLDKSSQTNSDGGHELARRSYFGRIQYDYADKYLFEANLRADASSRFPKDNRWGVFPAFSAGWRVSEENFIKDNLNWLSNLKLRLGWGRTGNEELSDDYYPAVATYAYGSYMFGNTLYSTAYESRYVNNALQWATITNYEIGLDAGFLNNKLGFELSVYKKKTDDMLLKLPVQGILGMSEPYQNAGSVENTGFDLNIFHNNHINKDFSYAVNLNIAYVKNRITNLEGTEGEDPKDKKLWRLEGHPIGSFYGYKAIGYFNTEEELANEPKRTGTEKLGDIKYADLNGDGKIDAANDRTVIGQNFPSWTGGLSINLFWKDFDFSALFQGAFDIDKYCEAESSYAFYNGGKVLKKHLDRWTPENHNASYPRITKDSQTNFVTSSFWLEDGSYVRLKNVSLGYNLPKSWLNRIGVSRIKVYIAGENLLTFCGLEDIDPEESSTRGWSYTNVKKVSLGLKVSF
ncbi:MAG: SusC/RagA family TonB-linked outer membrane protein, partial [Bacteroides fragilis]